MLFLYIIHPFGVDLGLHTPAPSTSSPPFPPPLPSPASCKRYAQCRVKHNTPDVCLDLDPGSTPHQLGDLGQVYQLPCGSTFLSVKMGTGITTVPYLLGSLRILNEMVHVMPLEEGLAQGRCLINVSYYFHSFEKITEPRAGSIS